jgi:hypothetical protein
MAVNPPVFARGAARCAQRLLAGLRQWLDNRLLGRRFGFFTFCGIAPSPCCERRRTNPRAERTKAGSAAWAYRTISFFEVMSGEIDRNW